MPTLLSRRAALRTLASSATVAGIATSLAARVAATESAGSLKGRIKHSVCKSCYPKASLDVLCEAAKEIGIGSIDLIAPDNWPTLKKHGLTCAMAKINEPNLPGAWNRLEDHDVLVERFHRVIPQAAAAGLPNIICLSGNTTGIDRQQGLEHCATGLKRIMAAAEKHKVTIVLEMLNSKVNHGGYMADSTAWAVELVRRIGSERFKLLYDVYHMQIMEGNVIATIKANHQHFAHYHVAGVPGRHEIDDNQELNYPAIMRAIVDSGYQGYVAYEYSPVNRDALAALRQSVRICDV